MARSLTPGAIPLLEEAVHLVRRAPLATLVCHLLGAAPFALALLLFWNDINNSRTSDSTVARDSVVLAFLLAWMHCWRAVFAGRLRRQISAVADTPWTWRRTWNLFACQSFLAATRLVVMPLALITIFGFAWSVAFYRNASVLADREDLDPMQVIARARQLASVDRGQSWAILPVLLFLWLAFTSNLALTLAILPQLLRMLTGVESKFSSSVYYIFTPLFLWSALAIAWMAFDPFVQAVYCLRCFRGESLTTGEDIRAGLRMLPVAAVLILLVLAPLHSFAAVPPEQLKQSVRQTMQASEYDWRLPLPPAPPKSDSWFVRATDRFIDGIKSVFHAIGKLIDRFLAWVRSWFQTPTVTPGGAPPTHGLHWSLYLLIALIVGLTAWIAWKRGWLRPSKPKPVTPGLEAIRLDAEDLTADRLPEESWLDLAARSMLEQNFRFALRAYYLANLAWLGRGQFIHIHAGKTNREYVLELRRRARAFAEARELFGENIAAFESAWYGRHVVTADDADQFRERINRMKGVMA